MIRIGKPEAALCKLSLFILTIGISVTAFAANKEIRVQASADRNEIGLGDTVTVSVAVTSEDSAEASEPRVPSLDGLNLVNSFTSSSTSSKLMQGSGGMQFETVHRQEFNFTFSPTKTGSLQVGAFDVVVNGKSYTTKPIVIHVVSGTKSRNQQQNMPPNESMDEAEAMFQQLLQRRAPKPSAPPANKLNSHNTNEYFFVQAELDKTDVFEGEQITVNWYIYTRANILALDRVKFPDLKGFWKEVIEEVPALNFSVEVINGVTYRKALLASHALFPIKAGTAIVDEYKIKATVQMPNGPFGFGPPYSFTRASERVEIKVRPLPLEGKPADFSGAVGSFELKASVEGTSFPSNQPFSLKIRFDGTGNAKTIELPQIQLPPGLELYDTKNDSKFFKNGRSYKEFEVLVIPRQVGDLTIAPIQVSLFDPEAKRYYSKSTEPLILHITQGSANPNTNAAVPGGPSERTVQKSDQLPEVVVSWNSAWSTWRKLRDGLAIAAWILILVTLLVRVRRIFFSSEKVKDLQSQLEQRLKKISRLIDSGDWRGVGTECSNSIYYILGQISGDKGASQELQKLLDLCPPSIRRELGKSLQDEIDFFHMIGFAPEGVVGANREKPELKKQFQVLSKTLHRALELSQKKT